MSFPSNDIDCHGTRYCITALSEDHITVYGRMRSDQERFSCCFIDNPLATDQELKADLRRKQQARTHYQYLIMDPDADLKRTQYMLHEKYGPGVIGYVEIQPLSHVSCGIIVWLHRSSYDENLFRYFVVSVLKHCYKVLRMELVTIRCPERDEDMKKVMQQLSLASLMKRIPEIIGYENEKVPGIEYRITKAVWSKRKA